MPPDQIPGAFAHARFVQRLADMPGAPVFEREGRAPVDDPVAVDARCRVAARIEIIRHLLAGQRRDRLRPKMRVHRLANLLRGMGLRQIDVAALAPRVHARVRSSRAMNPDGTTAELLHRFFERLLDGAAVGLVLPADKCAAVVFDGELVTRHQSFVPGATA